MKIKTLVIAPYSGLKELASQIADEQQELEIIVEQADLREALPILNRYAQEGIEFIVSRGGTARLIREHTAIPVVEIQVSGYDILRSLILIKEYKQKVELIGFPNICRGVVSVAHLLDIDIPYTTIHSQDEVDEAVSMAKAKGVQVLLGDTVTVQTAEKYGLQGMMITSGRESVLEAFQQVQEINAMFNPLKRKQGAYQRVLHSSSDGFALFSAQGDVLEYNEALLKLINARKEPQEAERLNLFDFIPALAGRIPRAMAADQREGHAATNSFAEDVGFESKFDFMFTLADKGDRREGNVRVKGGLFSAEEGNLLYYLLISPMSDEFGNSRIMVKQGRRNTTSFAQMVAHSKAMHSTVNQAKEHALSNQVIVLYGEEGVGKKFIASAIHNEAFAAQEEWFEINILKGARDVEQVLERLLASYPSCTLCVTGIEQAQQDAQSWLQQRIVALQMQQRIIFLFLQHPQELVAEGRLLREFAEKVAPPVRVPPLRERKEDIEEYITFFIGLFNTQYGKQIVGVRRPVLEKLLQKEWAGNMIELRQCIEKLVLSTEGYYIEKEQLEELSDKVQQVQDQAQRMLSFAPDKTLAELERDIIQTVLQEENMNQTKAAKRLGINRTTLWRKLNQ